MREYGQIQCSFWIDPDMQGLSDGAARLAAYLLTGPHSNGLGCYRLPDGYIMADFGWPKERVSKAFEELFKTGFCKRCESTGFVIIPNFLRWNPISNGNVATAREREFNTVPKVFEHYSLLAQSLMRHGKHWGKGFANHLESLCEPFGKRYTEQDPTLSNHDPDPDQEPTKEEDCTEQTSCSPPAAPVASLIEIPLNDGTEHPVTQEDVDEWAELYPAVDVLQELRKMRGWCISKPRQRKTKRGIAAFINTWLAKEQDRGGSRPASAAPQSRRRELGHD